MDTNKKNNIYVIVGGWEEFENGEYSNTAFLFGRDGKIIGKFNKVHPAVGSPPYFWPPNKNDEEWNMKCGTDFPVFELDFGTIGIMTCYDGYFPESARILSLKGAEIDLAALREQRKNSRCFHQRVPEKYDVITSKISPQDKYK